MLYGIYDAYDDVPAERGIYCNRTLNLRSIEAIGYDMDYTLVHYNVNEWESHAYEHVKKRLIADGWPLQDLEFEPGRIIRGLVIDKEKGNVVKANRFGYIKKATHGTSVLEYSELREEYARELVDLSDPRWLFVNTLFSISAGTIYLQLVDLLDAGKLPRLLDYESLFDRVQEALDAAHVEGVLKSEIMNNPERFVEADPEMPKALLDQKKAGKKLMLITNSGWEYTRFMMSYAVSRFLPEGMSWHDIFEISVVSARKPNFFSENNPFFRVVDREEGLLKPVVGSLEEGEIYVGGNAAKIEDYLGVSGDRILYVGDHLFSDVNVTKSVLRWRTALVLRELERELSAVEDARSNQRKINELMTEKMRLEDEYSKRRLQIQKLENDYGDPSDDSVDKLRNDIQEIRDRLSEIDDDIVPLVTEDGVEFNETWGYLMRAGNDKSHLTRQLERYADVYTSRVSNFRRYTPFMYFRAPRGSLPHDPGNLPDNQ